MTGFNKFLQRIYKIGISLVLLLNIENISDALRVKKVTRAKKHHLVLASNERNQSIIKLDQNLTKKARKLLKSKVGTKRSHSETVSGSPVSEIANRIVHRTAESIIAKKVEQEVLRQLGGQVPSETEQEEVTEFEETEPDSVTDLVPEESEATDGVDEVEVHPDYSPVEEPEGTGSTVESETIEGSPGSDGEGTEIEEFKEDIPPTNATVTVAKSIDTNPSGPYGHINSVSAYLRDTAVKAGKVAQTILTLQQDFDNIQKDLALRQKQTALLRSELQQNDQALMDRISVLHSEKRNFENSQTQIQRNKAESKNLDTLIEQVKDRMTVRQESHELEKRRIKGDVGNLLLVMAGMDSDGIGDRSLSSLDSASGKTAITDLETLAQIDKKLEILRKKRDEAVQKQTMSLLVPASKNSDSNANTNDNQSGDVIARSYLNSVAVKIGAIETLKKLTAEFQLRQPHREFKNRIATLEKDEKRCEEARMENVRMLKDLKTCIQESES